MKVLLLNGSPHAKGCTFTALSEVANRARNTGNPNGNPTDRHAACPRMYWRADDVGLPVIVSLMTALSIWSLIKPQKLTVLLSVLPYITPLPTARSLPCSTVFSMLAAKTLFTSQRQRSSAPGVREQPPLLMNLINILPSLRCP